MAPATPELDVLRERDPALQNTDDWHEFVLTQTFVHEPGNEAKLVSLLVAEAGYPVTVVGTLEPLDHDDHHLYRHEPQKEGAKRVTLVLDNVRQFAFGETEASPAVWAAGRAGWHHIRPSKQYKRIFDDMCEAVQIFYYIADAYKKERYEGRGKNRTLLRDYTAQEIFENYAREKLGTEDAEVAQATIYRHKDFLISSMLAGKEGLAWTKYSLCRHLYRRFPDTLDMLRKRREPLEPKLSRSLHTRRGSGDTNSTATSNPAKKTRSTRQNSVETTSAPVGRPTDARLRRTRHGSAETSSTTSSLKGKRTRAARGGIVEVVTPLDGTSDASGTIPEVPEQDASEDDRPTRSTRSPKMKLPSTRQMRHHPAAVDLEPVATPAREEEEEEEEEESDEEIRAREKKNKSSLRPRASKANKSASRNGGSKGPRLDDDGGDEDDPDPPSSPIRGKRKHVDEIDENVHRRKPKRPNSRPHDDEGIDIPTSPDSSGDADVDVPLRLAEVAHVPDPVQEDTWVCALDGCHHKVYASLHPDSQRLIREHYALHAYDDDARVQLVKQVEAPSLPVSRLMEKVKMRAKAEGFPGSHSSHVVGATGPSPDMPENVKSRFGIAGQMGAVVQRY